MVKAFGIKGSVRAFSSNDWLWVLIHISRQPKLTIALLDKEDLRALAHLMNSYPEVLKEKALLIHAGGAK